MEKIQLQSDVTSEAVQKVHQMTHKRIKDILAMTATIHDNIMTVQQKLKTTLPLYKSFSCSMAESYNHDHTTKRQTKNKNNTHTTTTTDPKDALKWALQPQHQDVNDWDDTNHIATIPDICIAASDATVGSTNPTDKELNDYHNNSLPIT